MRKFLIVAIIAAAMMYGYYSGIRHAMTDSTVSVFLDGVVEIKLDGQVYEHRAF